MKRHAGQRESVERGEVSATPAEPRFDSAEQRARRSFDANPDARCSGRRHHERRDDRGGECRGAKHGRKGYALSPCVGWASWSARAGTFDDRQLDVLLDRLDGIRSELQTLNRRLDSQESLLRIAGELSRLNESLEALAYAALGRQPPSVRRRGTG